MAIKERAYKKKKKNVLHEAYFAFVIGELGYIKLSDISNLSRKPIRYKRVRHVPPCFLPMIIENATSYMPEHSSITRQLYIVQPQNWVLNAVLT